MSKNEKDNKFNRYIRDKIRQAREEAGVSQEGLAKALYKTRVAVSDLERGRVAVNASDLFLIAHHLRKPIDYFFPQIGARQDNLPVPIQEAVLELLQLPKTQQLIALEYIRQQRRLADLAAEHERDDEFRNFQLESDEA